MVEFGRCDDETVAGIVMNRRQLGGYDTNIKFEGKNSKAVMLCDVGEPFLNRLRQPKLSPSRFEAELEATDSRNVNRWCLVDFLENGFAKPGFALRKPKEGASIKNHLLSSGHSLGERVSIGS